MFGSVVERGNVATGHQILKKRASLPIPVKFCIIAMWLCACFCFFVCVAAVRACVQQRRESGHADAGSDDDLNVWECNI